MEKSPAASVYQHRAVTVSLCACACACVSCVDISSGVKWPLLIDRCCVCLSFFDASNKPRSALGTYHKVDGTEPETIRTSLQVTLCIS